MELIEITPEEIITLQIEDSYIFYSDIHYLEPIRFNYETQDVYYYRWEDIDKHWDSFNNFLEKGWELFKKENPNTEMYIINEE